MTYERPFSCKLDDDPGSLGLKVLAEYGMSEAYEYDFRRAWVDADGNVFTARTSGCSCGSPFDELSGIDGLQRVDETTLPTLTTEDIYGTNAGARQTFLMAVRRQITFRKTRFDADEYAKEVAAREAVAQERAVKQAIRRGVNDASNELLGVHPTADQANRLVDTVYQTVQALSVGETLVLGVYLATMAEKQIAKPQPAED